MNPQIGQIIEFNGYGGTIKFQNQEYLLLDTNIIEKNTKLKPYDEVEFIPEQINNTNIARFVKKRNYSQLKQNIKDKI